MFVVMVMVMQGCSDGDRRLWWCRVAGVVEGCSFAHGNWLRYKDEVGTKGKMNTVN